MWVDLVCKMEPDPLWGEALKAVVVLRESKKASEEELIKYCKGRIANYKI